MADDDPSQDAPPKLASRSRNRDPAITAYARYVEEPCPQREWQQQADERVAREKRALEISEEGLRTSQRMARRMWWLGIATLVISSAALAVATLNLVVH